MNLPRRLILDAGVRDHLLVEDPGLFFVDLLKDLID
jgi:hypothetical protein